MDKHWFYETHSHTGLPTLGIYLTARHSIPRKEMLHVFEKWQIKNATDQLTSSIMLAAAG